MSEATLGELALDTLITSDSCDFRYHIDVFSGANRLRTCCCYQESGYATADENQRVTKIAERVNRDL